MGASSGYDACWVSSHDSKIQTSPQHYARRVSERATTIHKRLKSVAGTTVLVAVFLVICWPGFILALAPAVRAAFGFGTPGVIRLDERIHAKTTAWIGEFRSDDGRVVRERVSFQPDGRIHQLGDTVPVLYNPTPGGWFSPGGDSVYPRSWNFSWTYPAAVTAAWAGVLAWAAWRLRRWLRRRGLLRERVAPPAPACSCERPDRCGRGRA